MLTLKEDLMNQCSLYVENRIKSATDSISAAKDASQDDTKSSAGDKYETTREMMQQEISRNEAQLYEAMKLKHALAQISIEKTHKTVQAGSVVLTSSGNFFISISAGQFQHGKDSFISISSSSPIGRLLMGLTAGSKIDFNGKSFEILDVN